MEKKIDYKKFTHQVLQTVFTQGALFAVNFVISMLVARWLQPVGKGEYSVASTLYSIGVYVGILGLQSAHTFYLSKDYKKLKLTIGNNFFISVTACLIYGAVVFIIKGIKPEYFSIDAVLLGYSAVMVFAQLLYMLQVNTLLAIDKVKLKNLLEFINAVLCLGTIIGVQIFAGLSSSSLLLIYAFAAIFISLLSVIYLCHDYNIIPKFSKKFFWEVLPYGLLAQTASLVAYLLLRVDILMIDHILGKEQTGIYSLGVNLADMLSILSSSVCGLLFPVASACKDQNERIRFVYKTGITMVIVLCICSVGMAVLAPILIPIIYGDAYRESVAPFLILLPGIIAWGIVSIVSNYLSSIGRFKEQIFALGVALIGNFMLNAALIPIIKIKGAALASTISYGIAAIILICIFMNDRRKEKKKFEKDSDNGDGELVRA